MKELTEKQQEIKDYILQSSRFKDAIAYAKGICDLVNDDNNPLWKNFHKQPSKLEKVAYYLKANYAKDLACGLIDADIYDATLTFDYNEKTNKVTLSTNIYIFPIDECCCLSLMYEMRNGMVLSPRLTDEFPKFFIENSNNIFNDIQANPYAFIKEGEKVWWEDPEGETSAFHIITDICIDEDEITYVELDNGIEVNPYELRPQVL